MTTTITKTIDRKEKHERSEGWTVIDSYSRAQALADGTLVAVDADLAQNAGFRAPVALTSAVYETCVRVPQGVNCQDETGRLFDVLWMATHAFWKLECKSPELAFRFTSEMTIELLA